MKKILSILLSAGMLLSQCQFTFADDGAERVLAAVKGKIDIPEELTEFDTSVNTDSSGKAAYSFSWYNETWEGAVWATADEAGHILNYNVYNSTWYDNYEDTLKIDTSLTKEGLLNFATEELKKIAPELFADENDCLVPVPDYDILDTNIRSGYGFNYIRKHNGAEVKGNSAFVSVMRLDSGFVLTNANITWDYTTKFEEVQNPIGIDKAQNILSERFPMELSYRKYYNGKYFLEYNSFDMPYINAQTGEEVKEDEVDFSIYEREENAKSTAADAGGAGQFTPQERAELDKINGLKSVDELLESIYAMPELDMQKTADEQISSYTYKSEGKFITSISIYYNNDKGTEKKTIYNPYSVSVSFDAQSGEPKSFYRYDVDYSQDGKTDKSQAYENADAFLKKYYGDKISESKKQSEEVYYVRTINGIPYTNNYISAVWDSKTGRIASFTCEWDDDVSDMPAADEIISLDDANAKMYSKYPVKEIYIKSGGKYVLCYAKSEYNVKINAFDGKFVDYRGEEIIDRPSRQYSDTVGHWVENIAVTLASYGIAFEGEKLRPDSEITQAEFLKLIYAGVCGFSPNDDYEWIYSMLTTRNIISDEEKNLDEPITRENAIFYLLRAMGVGEVAQIQGIFICDFADSDTISADKFGYCAIAKGFKIVNGSDGYLYPQNNITRAEALTMIYNYLTR